MQFQVIYTKYKWYSFLPIHLKIMNLVSKMLQSLKQTKQNNKNLF